MPIDFFTEACKSISNKKTFGLCDDPPPAITPAYIDENNADKWIGIVDNRNEHTIYFYAIDHCIEILRTDGKMESRCDGLLCCGKRLIFVELKSRRKKGSAWLKDGCGQLKTTIDIFKHHVDQSRFTRIDAYVCNNFKPLANQGHSVQIQKFKDETGCNLNTKQIIDIE